VTSTLDTKGREVGYVVRRIREAGLETVVVDTGVLGEPLEIVPDIDHGAVARAGGATLEQARTVGARGAAIEIMQEGLRRLLDDLHRQGRCDGVIALGGAEGAVMAAYAIQGLPIGVPKLIVTPVASGRRPFGPFIGRRDILVMHSVVDILGLNPISRQIFDNAAAAISGMVRAREATGSPASGSGVRAGPKQAEGRLVAITMLGNTTPAVMRMTPQLEATGYTPVVFHANGIGGQIMEELIDRGDFVGVIDFTTDELMDELVGAYHAGGPHRMEAAARGGIPQVVVPGCVDFFVTGPRDSLPDQWRSRPLYYHNPSITLVRASREEMAEVGRRMASKLSDCVGPAVVAFPRGGLSIPNTPGGVFYDPAGDAAFLSALRANLRADIPVIEVDAHINDAAFTDAVLALFSQVMAREPALPAPTKT
jgi:uncharacterized protein (UPF0261 family)